MKLITRDTDYAVRALCFIAKSQDKVISVSSLVSALGVPRPFLRKLLQILHKKGVLASFKGLGGGFSLSKPAKNISITDLMRIFQGRLSLNECFLRKAICPHRGNCPLRERIAGIEKSVLKELSSISIYSLIREK